LDSNHATRLIDEATKNGKL
jgi:hypothetical protein